MQIEIDNKVYDVDIIKKNNRNTYIRVKNGKIVVSTNYLSSKSSIIKLIKDNEKSIIKMLLISFIIGIIWQKVLKQTKPGK